MGIVVGVSDKIGRCAQRTFLPLDFLGEANR